MSNNLEEITKKSYENVVELIRNNLYDEIKAQIKKEQKEMQEKAYTIFNGNTYVELEYEVETNKIRFGFEINNIKRTYFELDCLIRDDNNKYIPNPKYDIFILKDGKLFMKQDELSVLYVVHNEQRFIVKERLNSIRGIINSNRVEILEQLYSMVSVEHKQKSPLYKEIRENLNK